MTDTILSKAVRYIHYAFMLLLVFGFILPHKYLIYYLFLLPGILIHKNLNDNKCMLTELESLLDNKNLNINNHEEVRYYQFDNIFNILKKIDIRFYHGDLFLSTYLNISIVCWIIGFIRFIVYYKKNISNILLVVKSSFRKTIIYDKY
jgi:hypothetical protein